MPERDLASRIEELRQLAEQAAARADARVRLARDLPGSTIGAEEESFSHGDADPVPIERLIAGQVIEREGTVCFARDSVLALTHQHGRWPLALALEAGEESLRWLGLPGAVSCRTLENALFLDVETTGLAGGTGTFAFLVGAAWFESGNLVLAQYLMRSPAEEPALLSQLAEQAGTKDTVVTFNGKAFDVPLLETRYTMHRRRAPFPGDHLDLLAGARRVWRLRLSSCRLANLEQAVLGVHRWDDVPGFLIPQLYLDYLRTGDGRVLAPVFDHNALDVLSLVTLAGRLAHLHHQPLRALDDDPLDLVALGKAFEARSHAAGVAATGGEEDGRNAAAGSGEADLSRMCYAQALAAGASGPGADLAQLRLAAIDKRAGDLGAAEEHWRAVAAAGSDARSRLAALVELAKVAEHRRRDFTEALAWVDMAQSLPCNGPVAGGLALRAARLRRRIGVSEPGA